MFQTTFSTQPQSHTLTLLSDAQVCAGTRHIPVKAWSLPQEKL